MTNTVKTYETPPPSYTFSSKTESKLDLTKHEIWDTKVQIREKNAYREGKLRTTEVDAFLHVVKSSLGSGFLAFPYAFHNIGLGLGAICTAFVAVISTHCIYLLVKSSQELCYQKNLSAMTYTETLEAAFELGGSGRFHKWKRTAKYFSNFFLFLTYYGVITTYVILVAASVQQVVETNTDFSMNIRWYTLAMLVVLLPVGIVWRMKYLVPFSFIANVLLVISCVLITYLCCVDMPPISSRPFSVPVARWPLFFSTALFSMEGIGTIMPIENSMRRPGRFLGCPGVLNISLIVVAVTYMFVGGIGYIKFGEDIQGSITLNLAEDWLSSSVKMMVGIAILFTYPLQLTASNEVVWSGVQHCFSEKRQEYGYYLTRGLMIIGTVVLGVAVPNLSPVLSFVGALGFSGLGLLMPTICEIVTFWDERHPCGYASLKAIVLLIIWAFITVTGTITSVQQMIEEYK